MAPSGSTATLRLFVVGSSVHSDPVRKWRANRTRVRVDPVCEPSVGRFIAEEDPIASLAVALKLALAALRAGYKGPRLALGPAKGLR